MGGGVQTNFHFTFLHLIYLFIYFLHYVVINSLPFNICKIDTTSHQFKPKKKGKKRCIFHIIRLHYI